MKPKVRRFLFALTLFITAGAGTLLAGQVDVSFGGLAYCTSGSCCDLFQCYDGCAQADGQYWLPFTTKCRAT